jgi:translation initiation factor 1
MPPRDEDRIVYATGDRERRRSPRTRPRDAGARAGDGIVRVGRETRGRRGKGVTTISGVPLPPDGLRDLAAELKRRCGSGGSIRDGVIEIQGDQRDVVIPALEARGFRVKRAGG